MCISAASTKRHDDVPETDVLLGASGGIYPLLDPQSKDEVTTETEISKVAKVAEPAVTPLTRNQFVAGLTVIDNIGEVNSVDPGAVGEGETELQEEQDPGIPYCRKYI